MAVPALRSTEKRLHHDNAGPFFTHGDNDGNVSEGKGRRAWRWPGSRRRPCLACRRRSEAQQKAAAPAAGKGEQFFPVLVYRTGAYAP